MSYPQFGYLNSVVLWGRGQPRLGEYEGCRVNPARERKLETTLVVFLETRERLCVRRPGGLTQPPARVKPARIRPRCWRASPTCRWVRLSSSRGHLSGGAFARTGHGAPRAGTSQTACRTSRSGVFSTALRPRLFSICTSSHRYTGQGALPI